MRRLGVAVVFGLAIHFSCDVLLADASMNDFLSKKKNESPKIDHETKGIVDKLADRVKSFNEDLLRDSQGGNVNLLDLLVRARLGVLQSTGDEKPIASLSASPSLLGKLKQELKKLEKVSEKPQDEKKASTANPSLHDLKKLMAQKASGKEPKIDLSEAELRDLSALLQLENQRRLDGKAPSDEDLLQKIIRRELGIMAKDSPDEKISLSPALEKKLKDEYAKLKSDYFKEHPKEKEAFEKDKLSLSQLEELFSKGTKLPKSDLIALAGTLGESNAKTQGDEFHWAMTGDLYRNLPESDIGKRPPAFDKVRRALESGAAGRPDGSPAPRPSTSPRAGRGPSHRLGQGPGLNGGGGSGGGGGGGGGSGLNQSGISGGYPDTKPAHFDEADEACTDKIRSEKRSTEFSATFVGKASIFHCGLSFVSKDPEKMKRAPEEAPEGGCLVDALTAKHCLNHGTLQGLSIAGVSQVLGYDLGVQSESAPISGGDDGAHLTLRIPCPDVRKLEVTRIASPAEFKRMAEPDSLGNEKRFPLVLGRNTVINERNPANFGGLVAEGYLGSEARNRSANFINFNMKSSKINQLNHGATIQMGDSGSGVFTCSEGEPVWIGAVSYVYGFPGVFGGAASADFLSFVDKRLPGTARDVTDRGLARKAPDSDSSSDSSGDTH